MQNVKNFLFDENSYNFLFRRIKESVEQSNFAALRILELLYKEEEGLCNKDIKLGAGLSDMSMRPEIRSLFDCGFIDKRRRGKQVIYSINDNGQKLLNDLREVKNNVKF